MMAKLDWRAIRPAFAAALLLGLFGGPHAAAAQGRGLGAGRGPPDIAAIIDRATSRRAMPEAALKGLERAQAAQAVAALKALTRADVSRERLAADRRRPSPLLATDRLGRLIVRNELVAIGASEQTLAAARAAGFSVLRRTRLDALDLRVEVLAGPPGLSAEASLARLREIDPAAEFDFNHLYDGAAAILQASDAVSPGGRRGGATVGMVDSGVKTTAPQLRGLQIEQRGFAGAATPQAHGTAVASILAQVGQPASSIGRMRVADVYGDSPVGGSAEAIVSGLAWLAESRTPVINISLVGPPNALLGAAVRSLVAKGHILVAPAGNDGPRSKDTYPASYPGVIAVSAVDARGRLLPEASRPAHMDFVAAGITTNPDERGAAHTLRGTSFAAPVVAGRLALLMPGPDRTAAAAAIAKLSTRTEDLGPRGRDERFGFGLVKLADRE